MNKSFQGSSKSFDIIWQLPDSQWKVGVHFNSRKQNSFLK